MIDFSDEAIENMKRNAAYVAGYQNTVDEVELHGVTKVRKIIENEVASSDDLYWEEYRQGREDALIGICTTKQNTGIAKMNIQREWDEELEEMRKTILREGNILERFDRKTDKGLKTGFFVEWNGAEYLIRMLRGQTLSVRKLWEIEK